MSLAEYYSTNYSKCNLSCSFLASWQGLAYPSHIIQVFALPIQILTFYIIWKKTPINMKMMKWPLLINHACCCWFDFLVCSLSTPYLFFHNVAFLSVGILGWLEVPNLFQVITGIESSIFVIGSYLYVFETRSSFLRDNKFRIKKKWVRVSYYGTAFLISNSILLLLLQVPQDQKAAKLDSLKIEPCPTAEFFRHDVLVCITDPFQIHLLRTVYGPAIVSNALFNILFHVCCTVYYLYIAPAKSISMETQKLQKNFFVAIVLQTLSPFLLLMAITLAIVMDEITHFMTQSVVNFTIILFGLHGILESFTVLLVHRPYRRAVCKMLSRQTEGNHRIKPAHKHLQSN